MAIPIGGALTMVACGGGYDDHGYYTDHIPPGADPPPGASSVFTDQAGRLFALVRSSSGGATLVVLAGRDGTVVGTHPLTGITPGGFAVDDSGTVFVADPGADLVHRIAPDGGFGDSPLTIADPRAIAVLGTTTAIASDTSIQVSGMVPIAMPVGGTTVASSISRAGDIVAVARDAAPAEVVVVQIAPVVSLAYSVPLRAPDACTPHVEDIAFGHFGNDTPWRALDLECGYLYVGGAVQNTAATIVLASSSGAPTITAAGRLGVDGWAHRAWVSDGEAVERIDSNGVTVVSGLPAGATMSLAIANAGTLAWVGVATTSGVPVLAQVAGTSGDGVLATVGQPGDAVTALRYLDRPPYIVAPYNVSPECDTNDVAFGVYAQDPDGDPVDVFVVGGEEGQTFEDGVFTGTFEDWGSGADAQIYFDAMSGYYLTHARVDVFIEACAPPAEEEPEAEEDDDDDDDRRGGCACQCTVVSPREGRPSRASIAAGISVLAFTLRRRRAFQESPGRKDRRTSRRLCAVGALAFLASCAGGNDPERRESSWAGGVYDVTAEPPSQPCGNAMLTFTGETVYFVVTTEGKGVAALWAGSYLAGLGFEVVPGSLVDDHFTLAWEDERSDALPCPATGAVTVTTYTNTWAGYATGDSFESQLLQHLEDDCGAITPCDVQWQIHGDRQ